MTNRVCSRFLVGKWPVLVRPHSAFRETLRRAAALCCALLIAGSCASSAYERAYARPGTGPGNGADALPPTDFGVSTAMPPAALPQGGETRTAVARSVLEQPPELVAPEIYPATGARVGGAGRTGAVGGKAAVAGVDNGVTLNFAGTDVREVASLILGETLGLNFTVDPRVQAKITARTVKPIPRAAVLETLESILASNGIALTTTAGVYQLVPMETVAKRVPAPRVGPASQGYGLHVVPLHYASAKQMAALLQPYVPGERSLQILEDRNVLLFNGTGTEAAQVQDLVDVFDVDWLRGQTFALLPVTYANAESITSELEQVFGSAGASGVISFTPIRRLNAVLAISASSAYINEAKTWVARLDRDSIGAGRRTFVYQVQNARARDLAKTLQSLYSDAQDTGEDAVSPDLTPSTITSPAPASPGAAGSEGLTSAIPGAPRSGRRGTTTFTTKAGIKVVADESKNALLIAASREQFQEIESILRQLDVVPTQVLIEATIAEVTLTDNLRYGLQWFFHNDQASATLSTGNATITSTFPGFSYVLNATNADAILDALSKITKVKVVSSPTLLVLDNEQASLQVGDEVPVATRSSVAVNDSSAPIVNQIEFRNTGVILQVTPRVSSSGLVLLDITQEVSDVVETTTSKLNSPTVRQRKLASAIVVDSGKTVALGGLIRDGTTDSKAGVPLLSEIPILGNAFRATQNNRERTELLVLITPRISRDANDSAALTGELRDRLRSLKPLEQRLAPKVPDETGVIGRLRRGSVY